MALRIAFWLEFLLALALIYFIFLIPIDHFASLGLFLLLVTGTFFLGLAVLLLLPSFLPKPSRWAMVLAVWVIGLVFASGKAIDWNDTNYHHRQLVLQHDLNGNLTEMALKDFWGQPFSYAAYGSQSFIRFDYSPQGQLLSVEHLDKQEQLLDASCYPTYPYLGAAKILYCYNEQSRLTRESYYNQLGQLTAVGVESTCERLFHYPPDSDSVWVTQLNEQGDTIASETWALAYLLERLHYNYHICFKV